MAKLSHNVIRRAARTVLPGVFTDPPRGEEGAEGFYPGITLSMQFRKLSLMEWNAIADLARQRAVRYVTGTGEEGSEGFIPPEPLPPIDGQPVYISESSCLVASAIEYAQVTDNDDDRYTFEEIIGFMSVDAICSGMSAFVTSLQASGVASPKATT